MPVCQYCGKELQDFQGLSGHIQLKHPEYFRKQGRSGGTGSLNQAGTGTATTISSQVTPSGGLNAVLSFLRARGRRRMKNCPYAKKDERSGKLLCWYWGFYDEDDDGGLELISVEGKDCKRAVAIPELWGVRNYRRVRAKGEG